MSKISKILLVLEIMGILLATVRLSSTHLAEAISIPCENINTAEEIAIEYWEDLGEYTITAYCACEVCCGQWARNRPDGIVYGAYGDELKANKSCAAPLLRGTIINIQEIGTYIVQDITADWIVNKYHGKIIDIYFDSHQAALEFGKQIKRIWRCHERRLKV